jgi:hypothetical protein
MIYLPAHLLAIASQFVSKDPTKGALNSVHLRRIRDTNPNEPSLEQHEVVATNGHIAFRCRYMAHVEDRDSWEWSTKSESLMITPKACKVPRQAVRAKIHGTHIQYQDYNNQMLAAFEWPYTVEPCSNLKKYPEVDHIFPALDNFEYKLDTSIAYNAGYMETISKMISKYSERQTMVVHQCRPTLGVLITAELDVVAELGANRYLGEFVIMPVQIRL